MAPPTRPRRFETESPRLGRSPCPRDVSQRLLRDRRVFRLEPLGTHRFRTASTPGSCAASTARTTTCPWDAPRSHRARASRRRRSAPPSHPHARSSVQTLSDGMFCIVLSDGRFRRTSRTASLSGAREPNDSRRDVRPRHRGVAASSRDLRQRRHPERNPRVGRLGLGQAGESPARERAMLRPDDARHRGRVAHRSVAHGREASRARRRVAHRVQLRERHARRRLGQALWAPGSERGRARGATNEAWAATFPRARRRRVRQARQRASGLLNILIARPVIGAFNATRSVLYLYVYHNYGYESEGGRLSPHTRARRDVPFLIMTSRKRFRRKKSVSSLPTFF